MRAVNLLPRDAGHQRKLISQQNVPVLVGTGLGVVATGALALSFMSASAKVKDAQTKVAGLDAQLAVTHAPAPQAPPANANLSAEQTARLTAVSNALGSRMAWDRIMREFSLVLPDDVWLTNMSMTTPDPAAPVSNGLSLTGFTYSHDSVARLLARLALVPELNNVTLTSSSRASDGSASAASVQQRPSTVQFTITAGVTPPPGLAAAAAPPPAAPPVATDTTSTDGASS